MRSHGLNSELKWSKVSHKRLAAYRAVVEWFFAASTLRYRVIIVDQTRIDFEKYHSNDRELGFYKFYFQMLKAWILSKRPDLTA